MKFSPALVLNNIKQNLWIKRNGYPVSDYWSFINCKTYGFIKGIDNLYLTFPKAYLNWNKLPIETITPQFTDDFVHLLKRVFKWNDSLLKDRKKVIFFLNQPMHDDGSFDVYILRHLQKKYPHSTIYIKNHPLTSKLKLNKYKEINNVKIIDSKIPAEVFINELKESIVFSVVSTAMFIKNSSCEFYYTYKIKKNNNIERLKKYEVVNPTEHVISCKTVDEIVF